MTETSSRQFPKPLLGAQSHHVAVFASDGPSVTRQGLDFVACTEDAPTEGIDAPRGHENGQPRGALDRGLLPLLAAALGDARE